MKTLKLDAFNNYCFLVFDNEFESGTCYEEYTVQPPIPLVIERDGEIIQAIADEEVEEFYALKRKLHKQKAIYILKTYKIPAYRGKRKFYLNNVALKYPQSRNIEIPPHFWEPLLNAPDVKIYKFGEGKVKLKAEPGSTRTRFFFDHILYSFPMYDNSEYIFTSKEQEDEMYNFLNQISDHIVSGRVDRSWRVDISSEIVGDYDIDLIFDWEYSVLDFKSLFGVKIKDNELIPNLSLYILINTKTDLRKFLLEKIEPVFDGSKDNLSRVLFDPRALLLQF